MQWHHNERTANLTVNQREVEEERGAQLFRSEDPSADGGGSAVDDHLSAPVPAPAVPPSLCAPADFSQAAVAGDAAAECDDELPANGDCARARYALMSPGGAEEISLPGEPRFTFWKSKRRNVRY